MKCCLWGVWGHSLQENLTFRSSETGVDAIRVVKSHLELYFLQWVFNKILGWKLECLWGKLPPKRAKTLLDWTLFQLVTPYFNFFAVAVTSWGPNNGTKWCRRRAYWHQWQMYQVLTTDSQNKWFSQLVLTEYHVFAHYKLIFTLSNQGLNKVS